MGVCNVSGKLVTCPIEIECRMDEADNCCEGNCSAQVEICNSPPAYQTLHSFPRIYNRGVNVLIEYFSTISARREILRFSASQF